MEWCKNVCKMKVQPLSPTTQIEGGTGGTHQHLCICLSAPPLHQTKKFLQCKTIMQIIFSPNPGIRWPQEKVGSRQGAQCSGEREERRGERGRRDEREKVRTGVDDMQT